MKMSPALERTFTKDRMNILEAQRRAHEIAFAPITFQVARLMRKFGLFELLNEDRRGLTFDELIERAPKLSSYAVQVLLESALTAEMVCCTDDRFVLSKLGWLLLSDPLIAVNIDFNHDVNYLGMHRMEQALLDGRPEGLRAFGNWKTIYEGLSELPDPARESWFRFDHFYSDHSFDEALEIVFARRPKRLFDVGGNTGRWAARCVDYDPDVHVTIMDLPQQLNMVRRQMADRPGFDRIDGYAIDLLDASAPFPPDADAIWMSQFLDCFSEEEITSIVQRAAEAMTDDTRLFVMETLWDRQANDVAAFCLTQISLYFSVMANGNSKMYHSDDLIRCITAGGLEVEMIHDELKGGHSILVCKKPGARP